MTDTTIDDWHIALAARLKLAYRIRIDILKQADSKFYDCHVEVVAKAEEKFDLGAWRAVWGMVEDQVNEDLGK